MSPTHSNESRYHSGLAMWDGAQQQRSLEHLMKQEARAVLFILGSPGVATPILPDHQLGCLGMLGIVVQQHLGTQG